MTTRRHRVGPLLALCLLLPSAPVLADGPVSADQTAISSQADIISLSIEEARWSAQDQVLTARGVAGRRAKVSIYDADADKRLARTRAAKDGAWEIEVQLATGPCRIRAATGIQSAERAVDGAPATCGGTAGNVAVLANNDLGMHCADQDYRIFSILPPYNVIAAQVIAKGAKPKLLTPADGVAVSYQAVVANLVDATDDTAPPIATDSINSTSQNTAEIYKGNFWEDDDASIDPYGFLAYEPLYPEGILAAFPFEPDLGLPAPDVERLYLGDGALAAEQAAMPGKAAPYVANDAQPFHAYVERLPFFTTFGFGYVAEGFRRYLAEGVPILPVDDAGRANSYPLMRVAARDAAGALLGQVDTVLPVAAEADCQGCHLEQEVCVGLGLGIPCGDIANYYDRGAQLITADTIDTSDPADPDYVPGETPEQRAINAAKINILRQHDARWGTRLDSQRFITCATCHYSPALDLAHLGPNDTNGKGQTRHVSMSRAMHSFHGKLRTDRVNDPDGAYVDLFPIMPPPGARTQAQQEQILVESCYNCHPGKRTKCLRGAMETGGMVCQDCHGQGTQVGNDFTVDFPTTPGSAHAELRVPWASEPRCQSCHVGDVVQVRALTAAGALSDAAIHARDKHGNPDGLRLDLAYAKGEHVAAGGDDTLPLFDFSDSRFASNLPLYRLSGGDQEKGHGGLSCAGCHGSTHAEWPNSNPWANDNKTAKDLQGHTGAIIECAACHEGDLGITLKGPHGMHPVGGTRFADGGHEELAERDKDACRACHGLRGEGTVLSRAATDRTFLIEKCEQGTLCPGGEREPFTVHLARGEPITCRMCHENKL